MHLSKRPIARFSLHLPSASCLCLCSVLDPLVLSRAASLYLRKRQVRESVNLATLLCTHPRALLCPAHWVLLGLSLSAAGRHAAADEALAEALARDATNGAAWAARAQAQLARMQAEQRLRDKHGTAAARAAKPVDASTAGSEFDEAQHAFDQALTLGCEDREAWLDVGRLWLHVGFLWRAEQAYTRARILADDEAVRQKLQWIQGLKQGMPVSERESKAATAIQTQLRGALARKQVKKKKLQEAYINRDSEEAKEV